MRIDENGKTRTLGQDIVEIWQKHGLKVTGEEFTNNTWIIKAEVIKIKNRKIMLKKGI